VKRPSENLEATLKGLEIDELARVELGRWLDSLRMQVGDRTVNVTNINPPPAGAFENKITLFRSDGSKLEQYSLSDNGLLGALVSADDGDTILMPSASIGLSQVISVGKGVVLTGLSAENSIIDFAGVAGTMVTLGTNATLAHCTVYVEDTADPIVGVNACASGAVVDGVRVRVPNLAQNKKIVVGV